MRFEVLGETQVARAFELSARDAADMSEPLTLIGEQLRISVSEQFTSEGAHGLGAKWHPLDPEYAKWKRAQVADEPILVFSGTMRDTLTSREAITVTPQRLVYRPTGEHADVAAIHQAGEGSVPQRKLVALTQDEKRQWERTFLEWVRRDPLMPFLSGAERSWFQ